MTIVNNFASEVAPLAPEEDWAMHLHDPGAHGHTAQVELHALLLRSTRLQVWRLRHRLPGIGSDEVEDLAQQAADDALMSVLDKLGSFEGRSRFSTWVYKFGVLQAGVAVRKQAWRHREVTLSESLPLVDSDSSPAVLAESSDLVRALESAIATDLTWHQRRITLALLVEQVPIDVLAERLGTTRNALYKTLHDARRRLRESLIASGHLDSQSSRSAQ